MVHGNLNKDPRHLHVWSSLHDAKCATTFFDKCHAPDSFTQMLTAASQGKLYPSVVIGGALVLSGLVHKFTNVLCLGQAADLKATGELFSILLSKASRSPRVNFHSNGLAMLS